MSIAAETSKLRSARIFAIGKEAFCGRVHSINLWSDLDLGLPLRSDGRRLTVSLVRCCTSPTTVRMDSAMFNKLGIYAAIL